jgi:methylaspartate ammonia-lyase
MIPLPLFFSGAAFKLVIVACVGVAGFVAGVKLEGNRWRAKEAATLEALIKERRVDEAFSLGVSAAYEQVAAQLRRITTVNRVELTREVQKVEYRCPVPADAVRLLNASIDAANAAAGQPDAAVPADPAPAGERPGRTRDGVFGADGDVR